LIYAEESTPRLEYIAKLIFENILKTNVVITIDAVEFKKSELPKINYSSVKFENELYLNPHNILFSKEIIYPEIKPVLYEGETYFFETSADSFLPFDPLAASFFLVTRFEEYIETDRGKYNCYQAEKSVLSKYNLLKKPVVNIWARLLAKKIKEHYPAFIIPNPEFRFLSTIDIDNAWAFKNKGIVRSIAACVKDIVTCNWNNNSIRIGTWLNKHPDPYDNYNYINNVFKGNDEKAIFFFLLGDYKKYDKNISSKNRNFRKLIRKISQKYEVGIHPSYFSSTEMGKKNLEIEIKRLENIIGKYPIRSRQHFLRLFFPQTCQRLWDQGINEDYSMGYSAQTGFRAGICSPYNFYDLKKEEETKLLIFPFQIMDVTLREYLGLEKDEAITEIDLLMNEVRKVGGTFISIWHNESLTNNRNWKGYREVFEFMNKKGFKLANE